MNMFYFDYMYFLDLYHHSREKRVLGRGLKRNSESLKQALDTSKI